MMSERLRRSRTLADDAPVGLRFENKKIRKRGKQLKKRKRFEFLFRGDVVGVLEHAALLLCESKILPRPRNQFVMTDQTVRFHSVETGDGGELIVFDQQKNVVVRARAGSPRRQEDFRRVVRIAAAQIFVAQKSFQLIVKRSNFGASHFARERKRDISAVDSRSKMPMMRCDAHV